MAMVEDSTDLRNNMEFAGVEVQGPQADKGHLRQSSHTSNNMNKDLEAAMLWHYLSKAEKIQCLFNLR